MDHEASLLSDKIALHVAELNNTQNKEEKRTRSEQEREACLWFIKRVSTSMATKGEDFISQGMNQSQHS